MDVRSGCVEVKNRLERGEPTPEIQARAVVELRDTPEIQEAALKELRNLIESDDSLECQTDDEFLLRFLRPTKFYPESALQMIRSYLSHMRKHSGIYAELGLLQQTAVLESNLVSVSPVRDQHGRRVTVLRFGAWHSKICSMDDIYRAVVACAELGSSEPTTQIAGSVTLIDMKGTSLRHVTSLSPAYAKRTVDWMQGAFPLRFKAFHIINQPRIFDLVYAFFKPLLGSKLKGRIHFHGSDLDSLLTHVRPECLAREHGGILEAYDQQGIMEVLKENEHIFKEIRTYVYE